MPTGGFFTFWILDTKILDTKMLERGQDARDAEVSGIPRIRDTKRET